MENKLFTPKIKLILAVALVIIIALIWRMATMVTDVKIDKTKSKQATTQKRIDSLKTELNEEIATVIKKSESRADRGNQLIKNLPDEKIIIRDTAYDAMCNYITNYSPE